MEILLLLLLPVGFVVALVALRPNPPTIPDRPTPAELARRAEAAARQQTTQE